MLPEDGAAPGGIVQENYSQNLPASIQDASAMFDAVSGDLATMAETRGVDETKVNRYREDWTTYVQEFDEIVLNMHDITTKGAAHINDFIRTYCGVLTDQTVLISTKIEKLKGFEQKLLVVFGEDAKDLSRFATRVMTLKRNVEAFGINLSVHPPNVRKELEADIARLQNEINRIGATISSSRLGDRYWGFISVSFVAFLLGSEPVDNGHLAGSDPSVTSSRGPELMDLKIQLKDKKSLENELRGQWKKWFSMTGECCEKIRSIKNQLLAIQHVWLALRADSQALLIQLKLVTEDEQTQMFNLRLETLQVQYKKVFDEFYKFTHNEPIVHRSPQPQPEMHAQKAWLGPLNFFFQPSP